MKIYLIGMPGVGKSKTARLLAEKMNLRYVDLDQRIENQHGPIEKIFADYGEDYFRKIETKTLSDLNTSNNIIISCGGGIVTRKENKKIMADGITFFLDASLELIESHLKKTNNRPLLKTNSLASLYEKRIDLYCDFADYIIQYNDYESASERIMKFMNDKLPNKKILVINGPNLNMLGKRPKDHYGSLTLEQINSLIQEEFKCFDFEFFQSNHEGAIIDKIQEFENYDGIIINPGAYTHTSIAIHDALEIVNILKVEVHLSDIGNREDFRKIDYISSVVDAIYSGKKENSYLEAINYLKKRLNVL